MSELRTDPASRIAAAERRWLAEAHERLRRPRPPAPGPERQANR